MGGGGGFGWGKKILVTKISMDLCMEEHSHLWEAEGEMRQQIFPRKVPSASSHKRDL